MNKRIKEPKVGEKWHGKIIKAVIKLSNGWYVIKTENSKSPKDFKVKTIFSLKPQKSMTPKHAHFVIDFYGKLCANKEKAKLVFNAIVEVWRGKNIESILNEYSDKTKGLPGYPLEYILVALKWILEQEDINFTKRPQKKQEELDNLLEQLNIFVPHNRKGSQLAIAIFCDVLLGTHPVEALLKANIDVIPRRKKN